MNLFNYKKQAITISGNIIPEKEGKIFSDIPFLIINNLNNTNSYWQYLKKDKKLTKKLIQNISREITSEILISPYDATLDTITQNYENLLILGLIPEKNIKKYNTKINKIINKISKYQTETKLKNNSEKHPHIYQRSITFENSDAPIEIILINQKNFLKYIQN